MGGRNHTTYGDANRRALRTVPDAPLVPLPEPEHEGSVPAATSRFWANLTSDPARAVWSPQHHDIAALAFFAHAKSLAAVGPGWSAELRRLLAILPGAVTEQDRPNVTREEPEQAVPRKSRPDPRL